MGLEGFVHRSKVVTPDGSLIRSHPALNPGQRHKKLFFEPTTTA